MYFCSNCSLFLICTIFLSVYTVSGDDRLSQTTNVWHLALGTKRGRLIFQKLIAKLNLKFWTMKDTKSNYKKKLNKLRVRSHLTTTMHIFVVRNGCCTHFWWQKEMGCMVTNEIIRTWRQKNNVVVAKCERALKYGLKHLICPVLRILILLSLSLQMLSLLEHMYHELDLVQEFNINPITLKRWLVSAFLPC